MAFKILLFITVVFQCDALAQTVVRFTDSELKAAAVLMKPELNQFELHGQTGIFKPGPSLRAVGVDEAVFEINFSGISELANVQFNHLKGKTPTLKFDEKSLLLSVPIEDQTRAARMLLGAVNVKNVVLTARLGWRARADGTPELHVVSTGVSGSITGTGILRPGFMIGLVKKLLLRTLDQTVSRIIGKPQVQDAIQSALLTWAKFSTGDTWQVLVPRTVEFYQEAAESGLRYQVQ